MYINTLTFILALIAIISLYSGYRWIKDAKKFDDNFWLGLTQAFLGGVLFAIAIFYY